MGNDEEISCRWREFALVAVVEELAELEQCRRRLKGPAILLALIIVPRSLVPLISEEANDVASQIASAGEPLNLGIVRRLPHDPVTDEPLQIFVVERKDVAVVPRWAGIGVESISGQG